MIDINLKELSDKSGKTEAEIAKAIIMLLDKKAQEWDTPQTVRLEMEGESK